MSFSYTVLYIHLKTHGSEEIYYNFENVSPARDYQTMGKHFLKIYLKLLNCEWPILPSCCVTPNIVICER